MHAGVEVIVDVVVEVIVDMSVDVIVTVLLTVLVDFAFPLVTVGFMVVVEVKAGLLTVDVETTLVVIVRGLPTVELLPFPASFVDVTVTVWVIVFLSAARLASAEELNTMLPDAAQSEAEAVAVVNIVDRVVVDVVVVKVMETVFVTVAVVVAVAVTVVARVLV